jgi:hypothetical protein
LSFSETSGQKFEFFRCKSKEEYFKPVFLVFMANKNKSVVENYFAEGQKKRRFRRLVVVAVVALIFFGLLGYAAKRLFIDSDTFKINRVTVVGNKMVENKDVLAFMQNVVTLRHRFLSAILGADNMLIWPSAVSSKELDALPAALHVVVSKNYGTKEITVTVKEREPYGIWCQPQIEADFAPTSADKANINANVPEVGSSTFSTQQASSSNSSGSIATNTSTGTNLPDVPPLSASSPRDSAYDCWWFDAEGVMFQKGLTAEGNLIRRVDDYTRRSLAPGSRVLGPSFMPPLVSIFHALEVSGVSVKEVRLSDAGLEELEISTYNGPKIFFSLRFGAQWTASVIISLRAEGNFSKLEYVDFRVEGRVYYK